MRPSRRLLIFLTWFSAGLLTPVMSLMLLERGCTLETLPLVLGAYSVTVLLCEVPSGVFADLMGRKVAFLLSCALYGGALFCILLAQSVWILLPGIVLYGLGRAFSSGSLDALFIEECVQTHGEGTLATIAGQLSLWQNLGLAAGALLGGVLPSRDGYAVHLLARMGLMVLMAALVLVLVNEVREAGAKENRLTLRAYLNQAAGLVRGNRTLLGLFLCFFAGGVLLSFVETFWQPAFLALATTAERPLLGVVSATGFAAATLGNLAIRRLRELTGNQGWGLYFLLQATVSLVVAVLAFQQNAPGFLLCYGVTYLLLGGVGVLEQTFLNRTVPDGQRAGLLSASSLVCQLGGLLSCGFSAVAAGYLGFSGLFLTGGLVVLAAALGATALRCGMR